MMKQEQLLLQRLVICRYWLIVALLYYVSKASIVTFPLLIRKFKKEGLEAGYEDGEGYDPTVEFLQLGLCCIIIIVLGYTYCGQKNLKPVRWLLVLQAL